MMTKEEIDTRISEFKIDLVSKQDDEIISKYFYNDFPPAALDLETYHKLRLEIRNHFNLESVFNVIMVGSGRLGFSIKPQNEYRYFNDESDLDIAIISSDCFVKYWRVIRDLDRALTIWKNEQVFEEYFFNGWMRPDKLPQKRTFIDPFTWWDYFNKLSIGGKFGKISINAGLYYSIDFLEAYQKKSLQNLRNNILLEK